MKSNYRPIGEHIQLVDERNRDLRVNNLLGLSISKEFIPSVANTVGTNMSNYKVIRKNQFACSVMQVRRDKKMPVALLKEYDEAIISQAYPVFEVKDKKKLLPDYLMMWFERSEFDREACFHAVGGVRGSLEWEDFENMKLPIPPPEKQMEIVTEYKTIENRIKINEQLIQKLEETIQVIYKQWFVDFDFPNKNGEPYQSNGGEMVWNDYLGKDIPVDWTVERLGDIIESFSKKHPFNKEKLIFFNTSDILDGDFLHSNYMDVNKMPGQAKKQIKKGDILFSEIRPSNRRFAIVRIDANDYIVSTKLMVLRRKNKEFSSYRIYQYLTEESFITELQHSAEGRSGTFPQITFEEDLELKPFIIPNESIESLYTRFLNSSYDLIFSMKDENMKLFEFKDLLLSKMTKI